MNPYFQSYKYNGQGSCQRGQTSLLSMPSAAEAQPKVKELGKMHGLNTYDYGARQHDPILCRWDRMDPLCEKYYGVSPYAYCANNPVCYVDPDGMSIYLCGSYEDNMKFINILQQLTNDKIGFVNKTGEVVIMRNGKGKANKGKNYSSGTSLIRELISDDNRMDIKTNNDGLRKCIDTKQEDKSDGNSYNGKGSDVTILFDINIDTNLLTCNSKTWRSNYEVAPLNIALGHELIHGYRSMHGNALRSSVQDKYTFKDIDGDYYYEYGPSIRREETETVGIRKPKQCDFTENKLRKEHHLNQRIRY